VFSLFAFSCDVSHRLSDMKKLEDERQLLAKTKNEIESFIFDAQDKLEQRDYKRCSTEDERVAIQTKLTEANDWLFDQEDNTPRKVGKSFCYKSLPNCILLSNTR